MAEPRLSDIESERGTAGHRQRPHARRRHAAAHPGSAPGRRHRHSRPARPPPRRTGREFLAIPPLHVGRAVRSQRRLAALGARRSSLCARARMGSLAHDLDLARPFAVDGLRLRAGRRWSKLERALVVAFALGRSAGAGRRARRHSRPDAADREPQRDRKDGAGDPARSAANAPACRRRSRRRRSPRSCCCPTCGARSPRCSRRSASFPPPARTAMSCRSSIRPRKASPIRAASNSSSRKAPAASPPAAPRPGATTTRAWSRATARQSAPRPIGSAGASPSTAPTGRPANCCSCCMRAWAPICRRRP